MKTWWNSIFVSTYYLIAGGVISALFVISYFFPVLFGYVKVVFLVFLLFALLDIFLLYYKKNGIIAYRKLNATFSNFDENKVEIVIQNTYSFPSKLTVIDELPYQFAIRDFHIKTSVSPNSEKTVSYTLKPTERGEYEFGNIVVLASSPLRIFRRRYSLGEKSTVAVYPSYLNLNKYDLKNFKYTTLELGIKKTRTIGQSTEFEQIKDYVKGDDFRHINWKASAKKNNLMVNQFIDERSQMVFNIIDSGRSMQMTFDGLSLLDYAVNSSLVFSNVVIKNQDRAGIIYFNKKVEKILPPNRNTTQMGRILNVLYKLKTEFKESDFGNLYAEIKSKISHRSLLILYTNFEEINSLNRQMKYLKAIAKSHVLIVVFFNNTEVEKMTKKQSEKTNDYYYRSVAEKLSYQKRLIVKELELNGIQAILTAPQMLTLNTINKYLEIKAKGLI